MAGSCEQDNEYSGFIKYIISCPHERLSTSLECIRLNLCVPCITDQDVDKVSGPCCWFFWSTHTEVQVKEIGRGLFGCSVKNVSLTRVYMKRDDVNFKVQCSYTYTEACKYMCVNGNFQ
jgi:stage V sporulation protein SpoVS